MSLNPFNVGNELGSSGDVVRIRLTGEACEELSLRLLETKLGNCPAHFFIAFPANSRDDPPWAWAWQAAAGRGSERAQARNAAVCEAFERASLITGGPDDPRIWDGATDAHPTFCALGLQNFSSTQLQILVAGTNDTATQNCAYPVENLWICGTDTSTKGCVWVSALAALFGEDARIGLPSVFSTSTGTAVRETLEAAARHAILELVERDAVAIWWYNRLPAPRLDPHFAAAALPEDLAAWLAGRRRQTWHLMIPTDLPAAAVVALSARADGSHPAIGAAAAPDPADAVRAATMEMLQGEISLITMEAAQRAPNPPPPPPLYAWSSATNAFATPYLAGAGIARAPAPQNFAALEAYCAAAGITIVTVDLTRPELGVPVVKALSPQLRDWLPRFGPGRLYDVPVALGLRAAPLAEADLNPIPFVI